MEDIDKNGDGLIDLDEYIGEFFLIQCHINFIPFYYTLKAINDARNLVHFNLRNFYETILF